MKKSFNKHSKALSAIPVRKQIGFLKHPPSQKICSKEYKARLYIYIFVKFFPFPFWGFAQERIAF